MGPNETSLKMGVLYTKAPDGSYTELGKFDSNEPITVMDNEPQDLENVQDIINFINKPTSFTCEMKLSLRARLRFLRYRIILRIKKIFGIHSPSKEWTTMKEEK